MQSSPAEKNLTFSTFTFSGSSVPFLHEGKKAAKKVFKPAGRAALDAFIHASNKYLLSTYCVQGLSKAYDYVFVLKAPEEIQVALGILENQGHVACQEAWGTWECQVMYKDLL